MKVISACLTLFLLSSFSTVLQAQSPVLKQYGLSPSNLRGEASFSWFIFNVFSAKFYSEHPVSSFEDLTLASGNLFLELTYNRPLARKDFISSSEESLASNPDIIKPNIDRRLQDLYQVYEKVEAGDRYALFYFSKSEKTCLYRNDSLKVCIPGQDFAKAYFGIWLSKYSVDPGFSEKLLGLKN